VRLWDSIAVGVRPKYVGVCGRGKSDGLEGCEAEEFKVRAMDKEESADHQHSHIPHLKRDLPTAVIAPPSLTTPEPRGRELLVPIHMALA
jgi:hypothetical protein